MFAQAVGIIIVSLSRDCVIGGKKNWLSTSKAATEPEIKWAPLFLSHVQGVGGEVQGLSSLLIFVSGSGVLCCWLTGAEGKSLPEMSAGHSYF